MNKQQHNRTLFKVPRPAQLPLEALCVVDAARFFLEKRHFDHAPRGRGQKILVLPGYGTNDNYTQLLRKYLDDLGYQTSPWGLGHNHGNVPFILREFGRIVKELYAQVGEKIILIGWSLGGYIAREIARDNPDLIRCVVTLGSPVVGGPKYTVFAGSFKTNGQSLNELEAEIDRRYEKPITCPVLAIYSKRDNIVSWQACIDHVSPYVTHQEIHSTHIGFMANPDGFLHVALFLGSF